MTTAMNDDLGRKRLNELWARGREFLGTEHAILAGAMSWVSERNFVSAISNAGGFGVIACGSMQPDMLADEIKATVAMTDKPFGVNLITMHPDLDDLVQVCRDQDVSHVVLAGGLPPSKTIGVIKDFGAKLICFAPALVMAKKLVRSGVDALVIEGSEAGGHIGPVSTQVLAQEILPNIDAVPIFVAGGIGRGEAITQFLRMGASGCQLGTRFVCAEESIAHPNFKKAFIRANARDAQASVQLDRQFPVIPVRALNNAAAIEFMDVQKDVIVRYQAGEIDQEAAQLEIERFWVGALRAGVMDGDVEAGSLMAGQSVGMVKKEQPMQEIIDELVDQAVQALND
ncbi:MAG: 2-nitropropane dioxygenase [Alphaproteobacteria bacterium]|nr:MAG: 2-nitropropane dioxygenase [Alphaproteobacteria bacterium]